MNNVVFTCDLVNQSPIEEVGIEFWIDNDKFFDRQITTGTTAVSHSFSDESGDHILKIILKNKQNKHTQLDEDNNIISDILPEIHNICFDKINIDQLFSEHAVYTHNFNGNGKTISTSFYRSLGCNGEVVFKFTTPFYMWLLEYM